MRLENRKLGLRLVAHPSQYVGHQSLGATVELGPPKKIIHKEPLFVQILFGSSVHAD